MVSRRIKERINAAVSDCISHLLFVPTAISLPLFIHLSHQNNGACMGERMWAQICAHIAKGQYAAGWYKAYSRFRADHCNSIRMIVSRWKHDGWIGKSRSSRVSNPTERGGAHSSRILALASDHRSSDKFV